MSAPRQTAVVIANPAARGAVELPVLLAAARALEPRGWDVTIEVASSRADTVARAERHARAGIDAVLACGGDGTLLTVVNGVRAAGEGVTTAVGVIPAGTANVWAAEAVIPRDPTRALALLVHGERRRVDLGVAWVGDEARVRFLLVCGAGLDAAAVEAVEARPGWKRLLGRTAYGLFGLATLASVPAVETVVILDGDEVRLPRLFFACAANTHRYGGVVALTRRQALDDGLVEVTMFEGDGLWARLGLGLQAVRGRLDERAVRGIVQRQASRITITPARSLPVEVDGDAVGHCGPDAPLHVEVEPRAVTMIVGS